MKTGASITEFIYLQQKRDKSNLLSDCLQAALMLEVKQFYVLSFRTSSMREPFSIIESLAEDTIQGVPLPLNQDTTSPQCTLHLASQRYKL